MRALNLTVFKLVIILLLISCNTRESKNIPLDTSIAQKNVSSSLIKISNSITINGEIYTLESDTCVSQINDDHSWLTFKAYNDDLDYTLTVVLMVFEGEINSGDYVYSNGENEVDFAVITFVTEEATYVFNNGFVSFTKNSSSGIVTASNLTLFDSFENLPNIEVSFTINCSL